MIAIRYGELLQGALSRVDFGVLGADLELMPDAALTELALEPEEEQQAQSLLRSVDRDHFRRRRVLLRLVLGGLLDRPAWTVRLRPGQAGKPMLDDTRGFPGLHFSCSRRGAIWVCSWSRNAAIGCDLECWQACFEDPQFVAQYLSRREEGLLKQLGPTERGWAGLTAWAAKEAWLKQVGCGLLSEPAELDLLEAWNSAARVWECRKPVIFFTDEFCSQAGPECVGAVALEGESLAPQYCWLS